MMFDRFRSQRQSDIYDACLSCIHAILLIEAWRTGAALCT
jgi:hypothetical protein